MQLFLAALLCLSLFLSDSYILANAPDSENDRLYGVLTVVFSFFCVETIILTFVQPGKTSSYSLLLTYLLTYSLTPLLTYLLTHSLLYSLIHLFKVTFLVSSFGWTLWVPSQLFWTSVGLARGLLLDRQKMQYKEWVVFYVLQGMLTHSLTHSYTHSLTYSFLYSLTHSLTYSLTIPERLS